MKWTRDPERAAAYVAGPYRVEQRDTLPTTPRQRTPGRAWFASGPGIADVELGAQSLKSDAQLVCEHAAAARITEATKYTVEPVVGDWAYVGEYCRITATFTGGTGNPVYVLLTPRRKRRCLSRYEFPLVTR